jgi:predicted RecB family nuclease
MLPGLSRLAKQHLLASGITTLGQIAAMPPEALTQFKGIKTTARAVHAQARAFVENRPIWLQELPDLCHQNGVMFDLETDPFTQLPWSWGWVDMQNVPHVLIVANGRHIQTVLLPDGRSITVVPDKDIAWQVFAQALRESDCPIYHWTGFDAGVMRSTAPWAVRQQLEHQMHDLHHSFKHTVKFPVQGNSLKVVARYLKFDWAEYDAWDAAYWDYQRWLRRGDVEALARSCNYQQADVEALTIVWQYLVGQDGRNEL